MKDKQNGWTMPLVIIAVILGVAMFKQFDFETFRFKKLGLGIVYLITFIGVVAAAVWGRKSKE